MTRKKRAIIDQKKCDRSSRCPAMRICPVDAFFKEDGQWVVDIGCTGCGKCAIACKQQAIIIA